MKTFDLESFVRGYMECALWSSNEFDEDSGIPLDENFSIDDIAPECAAAMRSVCEDFAKANMGDLLRYCKARDNGEREDAVEAYAGHDFWLTRNGHGVGFWDRGLGALGDRLSDAAKVYSGVDLYPGDDGLIYGETQ